MCPFSKKRKPTAAPKSTSLVKRLEDLSDDWAPVNGDWVYVSQCHCGYVPCMEDNVLVDAPTTCKVCGCRNAWHNVVGREVYEFSVERFSFCLGAARFKDVYRRAQRFELRSEVCSASKEK